MPPLTGGPALSHVECWPAWLFYAPLWLWIVGLMIWHRGIRLPLLANPGFPAGGLVGEEKSLLFRHLSGPERVRLPRYVAVKRWAAPVATQWPLIMGRLDACGLDYGSIAALGVYRQRLLLDTNTGLALIRFGSHPVASNLATDDLHRRAMAALRTFLC